MIRMQPVTLKNLFLMLGTVLLLSSCTPPVLLQPEVSLPGASLHLYLEPVPQEAQRLTLTLSELNARRSDGREVSLLDGTLTLELGQRMGRQTLLVSKHLPPGEYLGLSLELSEASIDSEGGVVALLHDSEDVLLEERFIIADKQVQTLSLALNPERLVTDGYRLTAQFALWKAEKVLPEIKGVISNPETGTVSFFEKVSPKVVSVLSVGESPAGLALDQLGRRLFVALSGENRIAMVDLVRERVQQTARLRVADHPTAIALSANGRTLATANPGTNSVSILDTDSFLERARIIVPSRPTDIFFDNEDRFLYVLQPEANALSLISLDRDEVDMTVYLSESPFKGLAGIEDNLIYLLTEDSPYLLILDAGRLTVNSRVFVGSGALCLTLDRGRRQVYVGRDTGEIAVIDPGAGMPVDWFKAGGPVIDIAHDFEQNRLFVQTTKDNLLEVYDPVSHKRLAVLELAGAGYAVTVMGE